MITWSECQKDALAEIMNIGTGMAAATLFEMIEEEIQLSIPAIEFHDRASLKSMLDTAMKGDVCSIRQAFRGAFAGDAMLYFVEESSVQLVRMLLDPELTADEASELEAEALTELGNIILNGCLGAIANTLGKELIIELPNYHKGPAHSALPQNRQPGDSTIVVHITLTSHPTGIGGIIILHMDEKHLLALRGELDQFVLAMC